ncbi:MAG: hypothetical protein CVU91_00255 [Firmicutes bacterium HGW-Firmicutes-16]|nr:MAG: hypothetical protein CVU91_00255 [Firmicutes bacterium HGW-Firmicutes-16]
MKDNEMIERYVYAVTKSLPQKTRGDVASELRSIISDMLDERCGDALPSDADIRAVLTELGTPSELADKYDPDSGKCLIGDEYYKQYKFVLKIVLLSVAFGMAIAGAISAIMAQSVWYVAFGQWFWAIFNALVQAFAFVTLLFSFFYHKRVKIEIKHELLDDLPPVPKEKAIIKKSESIVGIVFNVLFAVIFLAAPQIFCVYYSDGGPAVSVFNIEAMRSAWYFIIVLAALGVISECVKLIDGRYSRRVLVVTVLTNLISVGVVFWWLMNNKLLNPEVIDSLSKIFSGESSFIITIVSNLQYYFLGLMVFFLIIDILTTVIKTLKYGED